MFLRQFDGGVRTKNRSLFTLFYDLKIAKNKKIPLRYLKGLWGWICLQMSSRFVADLKRLANVKRKMDEFDDLGKLLNSHNYFSSRK